VGGRRGRNEKLKMKNEKVGEFEFWAVRGRGSGKERGRSWRERELGAVANNSVGNRVVGILRSRMGESEGVRGRGRKEGGSGSGVDLGERVVPGWRGFTALPPSCQHEEILLQRHGYASLHHL
jgi:hypothetical protein